MDGMRSEMVGLAPNSTIKNGNNNKKAFSLKQVGVG
jgi:hypothetical protein